MNRSSSQTQTTTVQPPSWLQPQVQDYAQKSLGGYFLGNENPYMDQMIDRSSRGIINQIQSNFAGAGRGAGGIDAAGVAADRLVDLNAMFRGNAYNNERGLQQATLGQFTGPSVRQDIPMRSNILGGAMGGAMMGSSFGPWGMLGGGILGGLGGL